MVPLRYIIPIIDSTVATWAVEARILRWITLLWLSIGFVTLFSASYAVAAVELGDGLYYFRTQMIWSFIGLIGFNLLIHTPLKSLLRMTQWIFLGLLGLLLLTLIPGLGTTVNGATRWLALGPFAIQPSELLKPFLVLQSALLFGHWEHLSNQKRLLWLGMLALSVGCILLQPNLSTAALCGMVVWLIALASGLPWSYLLGAAGGGVLLAVLSVTVKSYQRRRLIAFLDPWADPMQDGYQLIQSLLAVGSGGFWGSGFGLSRQKLFYLPIQSTDFIFAVFAEEFGFVGGVLLLVLLGVYATLGLRVAWISKNLTHQLIAIGVVVLLVGQSLLNVGVATGMLPTTGLPFPLMSYGGSSMLASLMTAALLIRVARESREAEVVSLTMQRRSPSGSESATAESSSSASSRATQPDISSDPSLS